MALISHVITTQLGGGERGGVEEGKQLLLLSYNLCKLSSSKHQNFLKFLKIKNKNLLKFSRVF